VLPQEMGLTGIWQGRMAVLKGRPWSENQ
jgi:hypothetical protein